MCLNLLIQGQRILKQIEYDNYTQQKSRWTIAILRAIPSQKRVRIARVAPQSTTRCPKSTVLKEKLAF